MVSNEKIISRLEKMGPVDVSDGMTRVQLIAELSKGGTDRRIVAGALDTFSRMSKDGVVNTDSDRAKIASLITRETYRNPSSRPMARGWKSARAAMRRRKWDFNPSKGKGIRTFDKRWRGYLAADVKTKRQANAFAGELRKYNRGKVRVVPYQDARKTHYSIYIEKPAPIISKRQMRSLKKNGTMVDKERVSKLNPYVIKRNLHTRGIKKRGRTI